MITVLGSTNLDLIGTVSRIPRPGETVPGDRFASAAGGKGANQALAARRAGAEVRMFAAAGTDSFADEALALLRADGVDLTGLRIVEGPTGIAMIFVFVGLAISAVGVTAQRVVEEVPPPLPCFKPV